MHIGSSELLLIIMLVLVLFGANRFPRIMENFANGIKSFKKTMNENDSENTNTKTKANTKVSPRAKQTIKKTTKKSNQHTTKTKKK